MYLRIAVNRMVQSFPQYQPILIRNLERCVCTMQHNHILSHSNIPAVCQQALRFKRTGAKHSKVRKDEEDSGSDTEDENDDSKQELGERKLDVDPAAKIIDYKLDSPRVDRLLRKALNFSVKNVEDLFYEKKIQINGAILLKKSQKACEGDIITVPLEDSAGKMARGAIIEVLEVVENEHSCSVKVSRNKNTLVSV